MRAKIKNNDVSTKPYVVYWNNLPAPYMVDRFNALMRRNTIDLEVWFNDRTAADRSWLVDESTWLYPYKFSFTLNFFGKRLHVPPILLSARTPDVLVSLYAEPAFMLGWLAAKGRGVKTAFRVLMTYDSWVKRSAFKERVKRFLFSRTNGIETPGEDGKRYAMRYGAAENKIFIATHTVDVPYYLSSVETLRPQRDLLRQRQGLKGVTFIYVGRLWRGKGLGYLLDAFAQVQKQSTEEISLLLVGDGGDESALRKHCSELGISNVVFAGFKQKQELLACYVSSDVLVFPTLGDPYGLVVDEAMACSLPLISTTAAGEIRDRVVDGVNGYLVPPADSALLAEKMLSVVSLPRIELEEMGRKSQKMIVEKTPENWAKDFERMIYSILNQAPPKT